MPEEDTHKTETDYLKELIKQSGFPLEIETAFYLDAAKTKWNLENMDVSSGTYYLDKDMKKGRELDIIARIPTNYKWALKGKKLDLPGICLNLLIECKRIPGNAWVFFKTSQEVFAAPECTSVLDALEWIPREHVSFAYLEGLHYKDVLKTTLHQEYILDGNRSNKKTGNLFEALITLAKATSYRVETTVQGLKSAIDSFSNIKPHLMSDAYLFYPIVVFDGKMYLAEKSEEYGDMNPVPIEHVCLLFDFVSGSYNNIQFYVDIVQREAFDEFFRGVVNDIEILKEAMESEVGIKFRGEVARALKWYESKRRARQGAR